VLISAVKKWGFDRLLSAIGEQLGGSGVLCQMSLKKALPSLKSLGCGFDTPVPVGLSNAHSVHRGRAVCVDT